MPKLKLNVPVVSLGAPSATAKAKANYEATQQKAQGLSQAQVVSLIQKHQQMPMQKTVNSVPAYAQMMADPLNSPTVGKPDDSTYATNAMKLPDVYQISGTDTACYFTPDLGGNSVTPTITSGVYTSYGSATPSGWKATVDADNALIRVLAYVVQWQPTFSSNTGSGRVRIGLYQANSGGTGISSGQQLSSYFDDGGIACIGPANKPCAMIVRPTQHVPFQPTTGSFVNFLPVAFVTFVGMPAGGCGQIAITRIVEAVPMGASMPSLTAMHLPCDMMSCCVAGNILGPNTSGKAGVDDPYEYLRKNGVQLVKAAVADVARWGIGGFMPNVSKFIAN